MTDIPLTTFHIDEHKLVSLPRGRNLEEILTLQLLDSMPNVQVLIDDNAEYAVPSIVRVVAE